MTFDLGWRSRPLTLSQGHILLENPFRVSALISSNCVNHITKAYDLSVCRFFPVGGKKHGKTEKNGFCALTRPPATCPPCQYSRPKESKKVMTSRLDVTWCHDVIPWKTVFLWNIPSLRYNRRGLMQMKLSLWSREQRKQSSSWEESSDPASRITPYLEQ